MKFPRCLFTYSIKREIRHFHVVVVQKRAKKCTEKRDALAKLLFCLKPIVFFVVVVVVFLFLTFSFPSASLELKVSNDADLRALSTWKNSSW